MSTKPTIVVASAANGAFAISIPGEALRLKTEALERAKQVKQVTSAEEQEHAIAVVATLKGLSAGVEKSREAVKKPYWDAGKAIDAKAKEYAAELDESAKVIERMVGNFQAAERAKAEQARLAAERERREAEAAAERERERVAAAERAKAEAERAAAEAESRRMQAEIDAAEAKTAAAKKKAQAELAKQEAAAAEAARVAAEAESARMQAEIDAAEAADNAAEVAGTVIVTQEAPKASGAAISTVVDFEVTDIDAFFAWDAARRATNPRLPSFVKVEVRRGDLKSYLNVIGVAAANDIPGIQVSEETKAAVRAAAPGTLTLK